MPVQIRFKRDVEGIGEVLKSEAVQKLVESTAKQVATNVDSQGLTASSSAEHSGEKIAATVTTETTDRARASVTIEHPAGLAMQARHGVLTKAAAEAGLEVKEKGAK